MDKRTCFVIGPMGPSHIGALKWLAHDVIAPILGNEFEVTTPDIPETGNIMRHVIRACDRADLVVADTTGNNPNVLYEMAALDALGRACIPVKMVDLQSEDKPDRMPFDRAQYRFREINSYKTEETKTALEPFIKEILRKIENDELFSNPLTDFYGVPLSAFSAANGLARGYYKNFLSPALAATISKGPEWAVGKSPPTIECTLPERLDDASRGAVEELVKAGKLVHVELEAPGRAIKAFISGNAEDFSLVDIPTCMSQLRTNVLARLGPDANPNEDSEEFRFLEKDEIRQFRRYLQRYQMSDDSESGRLARKRLAITTPELSRIRQ